MMEVDGIWMDDDGFLHVDAERICKSLGKPPTPENKRTILKALREQCQVLNPDVNFFDETETLYGPELTQTDKDGFPLSERN